MAIPVLSPRSYGRVKSQLAQYRATTGRDMSPGMLQTLLEAEISQQAGRATEEAKFGLEKERTDLAQKNFETSAAMQREQLGQQSRAARTSGMVQFGEAAISGATLLAKTETGKAALSAAGTKIGGWFGGSQATAGAGGTVSAGFSPALTSEYGALETAGMSSGEAAVGAGASTAGSVVGGIAGGVSTAMPYYGLAKLGGAALQSQYDDSTVAGQFGKSLSSPLNVEQTWLEEIAPNAPGAVKTGLDLLNPIAPLERFFSGGSIICTKLHENGLLSSRELRKSVRLRKKFVSPNEYKGYLIWAEQLLQFSQFKLVKLVMLKLAKMWLSNEVKQERLKFGARLAVKFGGLVFALFGSEG